MIHYASFRYCGENYIAFGEQEHRLLVYVESYPGRYARHGGTLWPSWSKFMDGDEVYNYEEGSVRHIGEMGPRFRAVVRRAMASRFSDNPFQPANPTPEQLEWYVKRDEALRIHRESGDDALAIEICLFPSHEGKAQTVEEERLKEMHEDEGEGMTQERRYFGMNECEFEVTRTSKDSAIVEIVCDEHEHEEYIVGRIECQEGWGVGQREKGYPHDGDTFFEAVEHCAVMLLEECESLSAIDEVDAFFGTDAVPGLPERLEALAAFLPIFEAHDFEFGRMILLPGDRQYYGFSEEVSEFVVMCKVMKWV